MDIAHWQKTTVLEVIHQMSDVPAEAVTMEKYEELQSTGIDKGIAYFNTNWHSIRVSGWKDSKVKF